MRDLLSWAVRVAGFLYLAFYGVIDALAGIGTGTLVMNGLDPGSGHGGEGSQRDPAIGWLFGIANEVGTYGAWSFLGGNVLLTIVALRRWGMRSLPGGLVLVAASYVFVDSHIYWPVGVLAMLATALGFGLLSVASWGPRGAGGPRPTPAAATMHIQR